MNDFCSLTSTPSDFDMALSMYSDAFKEWCGCRPRGASLDFQTIEEVQDQIDDLYRSSNYDQMYNTVADFSSQDTPDSMADLAQYYMSKFHKRYGVKPESLYNSLVSTLTVSGLLDEIQQEFNCRPTLTDQGWYNAI